MLCAALPAVADTRFQVRRMTRDDVPAGKGQCDIRLQVDDEVEVSVRGDLSPSAPSPGATRATTAANATPPCPTATSQASTSRWWKPQTRSACWANPPAATASPLSCTSATRRGEGRYHFRLSWAINGRDSDRPPSRRNDDSDRPPAAPGFSWNNTLSFTGVGHGMATTNGSGEMRLGEVDHRDRSRRQAGASFRTGGRGRPLSFTGQILANEGGRWKGRRHVRRPPPARPMWISVDDRRQVSSISLEATDGQDRLRLSWDRATGVISHPAAWGRLQPKAAAFGSGPEIRRTPQALPQGSAPRSCVPHKPA